MENITEALQMAFGVLVFVVALSISINAFGEARQTSQIILDARDREYDYSWVENNCSTKRIVSAETIIPSIYKAYKENYKIVFKDNNTGNGIELYQKDGKPVYSIDLEKDVIGNDEQKEKFIRTWLYTNKYKEDERELGKSGITFSEEQKNFYNKIVNKKFEEELGVYYQEELEGESNTPNTNKTKKRVITYSAL